MTVDRQQRYRRAAGDMAVPRAEISWRWPGAHMVLVAAIVAFIGTVGSFQTGCLTDASTSPLPSEWCYRTPVTVTNATGAQLDDFGIRVPMNGTGLVTSGSMAPQAWNVRPTLGGFSSDAETFIQDTDSSTGAWWFRADGLPNGASFTYQVYTGNREHRRDNGIFFTGADTVAVADNAALQITDELAVTVELDLTDGTTPQTGALVDKHNGAAGYNLLLIDDGGVLKLRALIDTEWVQSNWGAAWTGESVVIRMTYDDPVVTLRVEGLTVASGSLSVGPIGTPAIAVGIGTNLANGTIRNVTIADNIATAETLVAGWSFDPERVIGGTTIVGCTEVTAVNPTYTGTCPDFTGNGHQATYTFTRDQTGISFAVGAVALTSAPVLVAFADQVFDVLGDPFSTDVFAATTENEIVPGFELFDEVLDVFDVPRSMGWAVLLVPIGLMLSAYMFNRNRNTVFALLALLMPLIFGVVNGWLPPWYLVIWGALVVMVYGTHRWAEGTA